MKRFLLFLIALVLVATPCWADNRDRVTTGRIVDRAVTLDKVSFFKSALTGGAVTALDGISEHSITLSDIAIVSLQEGGVMKTYLYVADDDAAAESSPDRIRPDDYTDYTFSWRLVLYIEDGQIQYESFTLPYSDADPTAYQFKLDTVVANLTDGALAYHNNTEIRYLVDTATLPTVGGQVPIYNATDDKYVPVAMSSGATMTDGGVVTVSEASANFAVKNGATSSGIISLYEDSDNGSDYMTIRAAEDVVTGRTIRFGSSVADVESFAVTLGNNDNTVTFVSETSASTLDLSAWSVSVGTLDASSADDPYVHYDPTTAGETEWWTGTNNDSAGDDNDCYEIRTSATPGTEVIVSICPDGAIAITPTQVTVTTETDLGQASIQHITGDNDTDNDALDLQDGYKDGQTISLMAVAGVDADDTITIAMTDTTCTNCPAIVFDELGENVELVWDSTLTSWFVVRLDDAR